MDKQLQAEVEELKLHQETVATASNNPLHLIREKELEISGRVLACKRQADGLVTEARKKAAEIVSHAERESAGTERESEVLEAADREAESLRDEARAETGRLAETIAKRQDAAVAIVLDALTQV